VRQAPAGPPPAPAVRPSAPETPKADPRIAKAPAPMSRESVASYRALLRDGRLKVQAAEYGAGIALFERALALRPGDPRLLVDLGWAAFLKGDLELAARATQQGLAGVRGEKAEGSALYNLGRIAEQRGDKDGAARWYRESLAVRPNAVVEKRLGALGVAAADVKEATAKSPELGPLEGPLASLAAVCDALVARNADGSGVVGCEQKGAQTLEIGDGPLKRALLLPVWRNYFDGGFDTAAEVMRHLVVETDGGFYWTRAEVSYVYNPGAFGIQEELESTLALQELVPGSPREIVVRAKHDRHDSDLGILEEESETTEWLLVCGLVDGAPRCLARIPTGYSYERTVMQADGIEAGEPIEHTPGLPIRAGYAFDVKFDGKGGYALTETAKPVGGAAAEDGAHAGKFSL
jgi:tetratricopeptide (TPR) repeat protein